MNGITLEYYHSVYNSQVVHGVLSKWTSVCGLPQLPSVHVNGTNELFTIFLAIDVTI